MRSAGKITEKEAFRKDAAGPTVRMQLILQLSRALAAQDGKLARKVIRDLPELANCIESHGDRVWIIDQNLLDALTQSIARKSIDKEIEGHV